jgi:hypothetical protein
VSLRTKRLACGCVAYVDSPFNGISRHCPTGSALEERLVSAVEWALDPEEEHDGADEAMRTADEDLSRHLEGAET